MIALYKDPKGEKIFSKYGTQSNFKSQQGTVTESNTGTTDSGLRRRILELENMVATNQVYHHIEYFINSLSKHCNYDLNYTSDYR
jgi:hypothetical protein